MCEDKTSASMTECEEGTFSSAGLTKCFECPAGFECPYKDKQYAKLCPSGTYSTGNQTLCIECPDHHRCPHRDSIEKCEDGWFSPRGLAECMICPLGFECKMTGATPYVRMCELGYTSKTG